MSIDLRGPAGDSHLVAGVGWQWGDVGTLYYGIRHQDLAAGAFERAWAIVQSY